MIPSPDRLDERKRFCVGFLGKRDGLQIPLALAEADRLGTFVTGAYGRNRAWEGLFPKQTQRVLNSRRLANVPDAKVESHWGIEMKQHLSRLMHDRSNRSWTWANSALSKALRDRVRRSGDHLLTYEPYAWEAFTADYAHKPHKVLFHFHLHPVFERAIIAADESDHPPPQGSWLRQDARPEWDERVVEVWRHADLVLCASSFTKQSLVSQGLPPERAVVVPYGIDLPEEADIAVPDRFEALFVGSAIQRKGLHHLLRAWEGAQLPPGARLTVVSRFVDPAMEPLLASAPASVRFLRGVSGDALQGLLRDSTLLVMPSLLEGFGQVYLEAMAHGCPVLGTVHSGLPDLGDETDGIFLSPPGDVASLSECLESLARRLVGEAARPVRTAARATAERHSWPAFRTNLISALGRLDCAP